ncbi:amidohydrolase family protein [Neolewinella lacunae]|uniref:Amidohydrolase family protein n=1 Tax=Neolewinella lacunae TaxID=1517758 RepID=A0A923PHW2_9BACT|nr:amidohydrolase family protein [Neolewinella lacunae]MBC6993584.1 amidohydrolase family protein [Neolewinella lacunae]MDN3633484.1 amidohydrolase family protein [Neolewinella lacunae]
MRFSKIFLFLGLFLTTAGLAAQVVGKATKGAFLLKNATIETVTKGTVKGDLLIQDGKITGIGTSVNAPADAKVIDCTGKFVYPGFIDGGTNLGLVEVSSVSLTDDASEIGDIKPFLSSLTAVNPSATAIPVTRVSGVTTVLTKPTGGLIPGTASLINLVGYSPTEMYAGYQAMQMNFPSSGARGRWDRRSEEDRKKDEDKKLKEINDLWAETKLFASISAAKAKDPSIRQTYNPTLEAMAPVVDGSMALMIEVDRDKDILSALKWIKENKVNAVLSGCAEGWRVAKEIAEAKVPVITGPVISIPTRQSDRYDQSYTNPGILAKAGVQVAIRSNNTENVRDLPFHAGFAAAYGMGRQAALEAITIVPARIMGLEKELGSLEVGKTANLFICDGDPMETKTQIEQVFIQGWEIPMNSRHSLLYDEFLERSPGVKN